MFGVFSFLPWTYPPQYDLLTAPFSFLPRGLAYLTFATATLAAYAWTIRRLAPRSIGDDSDPATPVIVVTLRIGQNGFLSGTLMGLAALGMLSGRACAGIPLGLMIIKPHLAIAFAVHTLFARKWTIAGVAIATILATSLLATVVFGPGVWGAFLGGVQEAGGFLARGLYQNFRMVSAYAMARSFGLPAGVAGRRRSSSPSALWWRRRWRFAVSTSAPPWGSRRSRRR